ncbi:MAG: hypothetical protein GXP10_10645, partial [Gammaproteobacteria bacterium]|nr:hypothetical protein [Gammaproteobacteria bacterium]
MAIKFGNNNELNVTLKVRDDGSVVIEQFGEKTEKTAQKASTDWKRIGKASAAAALTVAAAAVAIVKRQSDIADQAVKTADKLGLSVEALTELQFAAELTGVASQSLNNGLQRMTRGVSEAAKGMGEAKKEIRELGLDAAELSKLTVDQQFKAIAKAMEDVKNQGDKVRIGFKLFGREGVDLIRTAKLGEKGLADMATEARALGRVIDEDTARNAEVLNDNITRLQSVGSGFANSLLSELSPSLITISEMMINAAKGSEAFDLAANVLKGTLLTVATAGVVVATAFRNAGQVIGATAAAIVAAAQGDFSEAASIISLAAQDIKGNYEDAVESIDKLWNAAANPPNIKSPTLPAPTVSDSPSAPDGSGTNPLREKLAEEVATIRESLLTREQLITQSYLAQAATIREAQAQGIGDATTNNAALLQLEQQYLAQVTEEQTKAAESQREKLTAEVTAIGASLSTREQLITQSYLAQVATIREAQAQNVEGTIANNETLLQLEQQYLVAVAEEQVKAAENERVANETRLEALRLTNLTEEEELRLKYANEAIIIGEKLQAGFLQQEAANEQFLALEQAHQKRIAKVAADGLTARQKFEQKTLQGQVKQVAGSLLQMTASVANSNKT